MEQESGLLGAVAAAGGVVGRAISEAFMAEKRLDDTMAAGPGSGQQFKVEKDTVLKAGAVIQAQIDALWTSYGAATRDLRVNLNGLDSVNKDIAEAWNERLVDHDDSYAKRVEQYIESLVGLVEQLRAAAKQYGHTDDEVTAAMGAAGASQQ